MNTTILTKWSLKSQLLSLLCGQVELAGKVPKDLINRFLKQEVEVKGEENILSTENYLKWVEHIRSSYHLYQNQSPSNPSPSVTFYPLTKLDRRKYSIIRKHKGNSTVAFTHEKHLGFGQIEEIFALAEFNHRFFFVISPFKKLNPLPPCQDPYSSFPNLNSALLSLDFGEKIIIDDTLLWGHAVILKNRPGTFGIDSATCCAVLLNLVVRKNINALVTS